MTAPLNTVALDQLFFKARTHNAWSDWPVTEATLRKLWEMARMGPTSANCSPARIVFLVTRAAKEKLRPALMPTNVEKTMTAPVVAIVGHDLEFYEHLPKLFPHADARSWFAGKPDHIAQTAFRNGSLQGAYLILAARALGLDCGPMSGFDNAMVDRLFFPEGQVKSNFLCNLGYGDAKNLFPRGPRFTFEEACRIE
ncbi:MAG: malonic semialdehyde reductase [Rhodospirillales bacterium]|nr:malonic semialdehyde reductase [Rhodospirillales bacterium]